MNVINSILFAYTDFLYFFLNANRFKSQKFRSAAFPKLPLNFALTKFALKLKSGRTIAFFKIWVSSLIFFQKIYETFWNIMYLISIQIVITYFAEYTFFSPSEPVYWFFLNSEPFLWALQSICFSLPTQWLNSQWLPVVCSSQT